MYNLDFSTCTVHEIQQAQPSSVNIFYLYSKVLDANRADLVEYLVNLDISSWLFSSTGRILADAFELQNEASIVLIEQLRTKRLNFDYIFYMIYDTKDVFWFFVNMIKFKLFTENNCNSLWYLISKGFDDCLILALKLRFNFPKKEIVYQILHEYLHLNRVNDQVLTLLTRNYLDYTMQSYVSLVKKRHNNHCKELFKRLEDTRNELVLLISDIMINKKCHGPHHIVLNFLGL
jgi:hypothetical protein